MVQVKRSTCVVFPTSSTHCRRARMYAESCLARRIKVNSIQFGLVRVCVRRRRASRTVNFRRGAHAKA